MSDYSIIADNDPAVTRKPLIQHELDEIIERHGRFLRQEKGGIWASFKLMDLSYLDLSNRDLRTADFTGADLCNARLIASDLSETIMFAVDLREADLTRAILDKTDLRGSSLRRANLTQASLVEADLRAGRLYNRDNHGELRTVRDKRSLTDLAAATLTGSDLTHAKLGDALIIEQIGRAHV